MIFSNFIYKPALFLLLLVFVDSDKQLDAQNISFQKAILSDDGTSIFTQKSSIQEAVFTKQVLNGDAQNYFRIRRVNSMKTDIMWDIFQDKLFFIGFTRLQHNFMRCSILTYSKSPTQEQVEGDHESFRNSIYGDPPPLDIALEQAMFDNRDLQSFYQPYDFIINADGIYFIVANMRIGKYELWHYSGAYFTYDELFSNKGKKEQYMKSRDSWKKYVLSDITEEPESSKIMLVKDGERLIMFTPKGNIYQLLKKGSKMTSIHLGSIDDPYRNLLVVVQKKENKASFLKQNDAALFESSRKNELPFRTLNEIMKKK